MHYNNINALLHVVHKNIGNFNMKQAKLRINYGRTINTGNYESLRLDISLEVEIDEILFQQSAKQLFNEIKFTFDEILEANT